MWQGCNSKDSVEGINETCLKLEGYGNYDGIGPGYYYNEAPEKIL